MSEPEGPVGEDMLQAWLDDRLEPLRRDEVARYLARHPLQAQRLAGYAAQRDALRAALQRFAARPPPRSPSVRQLLHARRAARRGRWQMAAAVVLSLAIGGAGGWIVHGRPSGASDSNSVPTLVAEAIANYVVYTADYGHPVELAADRDDGLASWLSNRLNRRLRMPDLAAAGYRLMGGRLIATAHGPAALLMYDDARGRRLTVYARPTTMPQQDTATVAVKSEPVSGYAWICDGLGYVVLATAGPPELRQIAVMVRRQVDPT
jgi:anti-sigma factor RsiW